mgnify:CR=1 FL=1
MSFKVLGRIRYFHDTGSRGIVSFIIPEVRRS